MIPISPATSASPAPAGHRILSLSGRIPEAATLPPADFKTQARIMWSNIAAQLQAADMSYAHLAKVTTFLADPEYATENRLVRQEVLGRHAPALAVIITDIVDKGWMLDIEVVAAV